MSLGGLGERKPRIVSLATCQGRKRYLWLNGALLDLSEFPDLVRVVSMELKKDSIAGSAEDWQRLKRKRKREDGEV